MVSIKDFAELKIQIGVIEDVKDHPDADRLYVLKVNIGSASPIQIVAGIRNYYQKNSLIEKKICVITNLDKAVIRGVESQGMLLAAKDTNDLGLITPDKDIEIGSSVS